MKIDNKKYLLSAIDTLYNPKDDFIVIGLTGQTGSGCSTVAQILSDKNPKYHINKNTTPLTNEQRKQNILINWIENNWEPFYLIQVRSIISLLLGSQSLNTKTSHLLSNFKKEISKIQQIVSPLYETHLDYIDLVLNKNLKNKRKAKEIINFYTKTLPDAASKIKREIGESKFVRFYQEIGTNIRLSGSPYSKQIKKGSFFKLAETINDILKIIKYCNRPLKKRTFVVIDAIRNPLEAIYFQDRYAAFFLMAVSTSEQERIERLRKLNYSETDIEDLSKSEYKQHKPNSASFFTVQDIKSCLQRADLYINNPNTLNAAEEFNSLAFQVLRFVALMREPGIVTPTHIERCMQVAYTAKLNSGCISRQVGAVVTGLDFSIKSLGWNDVALGQVPCNLRNRFDLEKGIDLSAYSDYELSKDFQNHIKETNLQFHKKIVQRNNIIPFCFKSEFNSIENKENQVHTRSLHAEENAFLQITKQHNSLSEGGFLFTTASPCELCSKKAYQLGIKKIYYIDPYPGIAIDQILRSGSNRPALELFSGAIGKAFHRLYTPIVPLKDKINAFNKTCNN